jgi:hypothetical protein
MSNAETRARWTLLGMALLLVAAPLAAQTVRVTLKLPVKPALDLDGRNVLATAPFIVVRQEGEGAFRGRQIDVQEDFQRYLLKLLRRDTDLSVRPLEHLDYPSYDLDFDIQDRSGYRLEEYVSPFDGRTYYRQILVEETGFEFDILLHVYDGRTGDLLFTDNFKDFKTLGGAGADPVVGLFSNLRSLEDRMAGIFAKQEVEATRVLFRP